MACPTLTLDQEGHRCDWEHVLTSQHMKGGVPADVTAVWPNCFSCMCSVLVKGCTTC